MGRYALAGGVLNFALLAWSRIVVEHVRLHPVGGCSAQRLTNLDWLSTGSFVGGVVGGPLDNQYQVL